MHLYCCFLLERKLGWQEQSLSVPVLRLFAFMMKEILLSSTGDSDRAKNSQKEDDLQEERWPWG